MRNARFIALAAGSACGILAALSLFGASPASAEQGFSFANELLSAHNQEREHRGLPLLEWSSRLAQDAQNWAQKLAAQGRLQHGSDRSGAGENLWMGSAGYYSATEMVGGFVSERAAFRPGPFPQVSRTGNWQDVAHYTQVVWPATREVGCAVARGAQNDVLVCRYFPAGNIVGQRVL